jgi:hypothetical protein
MSAEAYDYIVAGGGSAGDSRKSCRPDPRWLRFCRAMKYAAIRSYDLLPLSEAG